MNLNLNNELSDKLLVKEEINTNLGVDKTIDDVTKTLEENIQKEIENLKLDDSIFEKIGKSKAMEVVKIAIESVLKGVLKKKFGINFSTWSEAVKLSFW